MTSLRDLGREASNYGVSVITKPSVTLKVLEEAKELKIERLWLQPGSEDEEAKSIREVFQRVFWSPLEVLKRAEELQLGRKYDEKVNENVRCHPFGALCAGGVGLRPYLVATSNL